MPEVVVPPDPAFEKAAFYRELAAMTEMPELVDMFERKAAEADAARRPIEVEPPLVRSDRHRMVIATAVGVAAALSTQLLLLALWH